MDDRPLDERISTLSDSKPRDWGTKVQQLCEETWAGIDRLSASDVAAFTRFLNGRSDVYQLAELVIPELRAPPPGPLQLLERHRQVVDGTADQRAATGAITSATQASFDQPFYRAEKDRLLDGQLHRARLLLQHSGKLGPNAEAEIQEWLDKAPKEEPSAGARKSPI